MIRVFLDGFNLTCFPDKIGKNIEVLLLIAILACTSLKAAEPEKIKVGIVDLITATVLHPRMALFDFQKFGFLKIPLNLSQVDRESRIKQLRESQKEGFRFQKELEEIKAQRQTVEQKRTLLLLEKIPSSDKTKFHDKEQKLAHYKKNLDDLDFQEKEISKSIQFSELTSLLETEQIFKEIENEVQDAVEQVASERGISLVLNASSFVPPSKRAEDQFPSPIDGPISWLTSDLYYFFLTHEIEIDNKKQKVAPGTLEKVWLQNARHPLALLKFPISNYPLVLKGGIDLTPDIVDLLLRKFNCSSEARQALKVTVQSWRNIRKK